MDHSQDQLSGFPPNVQEQLLQAAASAPAHPPNRGRGQNRRGRAQYQPFTQHHNQVPPRQQMNGQYARQTTNPQSWGGHIAAPLPDNNSFPPLGTSRSQQSTSNQHQQQQQSVRPPNQQQPANYQSRPSHFQQTHPNVSQPQQQPFRRDFPHRGQGGPHRGRGQHHFAGSQAQPHYPSQNTNDFQRPAPVERKLFTPGMHPHFSSMEEQRAFQNKIINQSDFLNFLANQSLKDQITTEEQQAKECFRKELESIAQKAIAGALTSEHKFNIADVHLKLYGSLGSGFGVAGSDMDLLLAFPTVRESLGDIEIESRRLLEKALLDANIGARLLTNTRVPILRVCEKPSPELLKNLRDYRAQWERSLIESEPPVVDKGLAPLPALMDTETVTAALAELDLTAHEIPLPGSPSPEGAKLEFIGDCGIQCDINFTNYVALHNTRLLRTYGMCDSRVRQVGVFVKSWAKARDINTPYRGTLSSYGYIMMVLHYLMNVVNPPVIPNLQDLAKQKDAWEGKTDIQLVEGFDVRFVRDMNEVQTIVQDMPRNHESVGSLLRGFFWYYADPRGFRWNQDIISIRSRGGRINKRSKGWTEAKWSGENQHVRLRYLLAIEDPFEIEHNIGRTVGHSGLVAIRDEFRRAWSIIDNIEFDNANRSWYWLSHASDRFEGIEMISGVENRGDLLRKDQDYHRQKIRQMRQALEAKEKALQAEAIQEGKNEEEAELNGTSAITSKGISQGMESLKTLPSSELIIDGDIQVKKQQQKPTSRRVLQVDEDEEESEVNWATSTTNRARKDIDWSRPFDETEIHINDEWQQPETNEWEDPKADGWQSPKIDYGEQSKADEWQPPKMDDWEHPKTDERQHSRTNEWEFQKADGWEPTGINQWEQTKTDEWEPVTVNERNGNSTIVKSHQASSEQETQRSITYAEEPNDQCTLEQVQSEISDVVIEWNNRSKGGRWLRWRDDRIREGNWRGCSNPVYKRLDAEFPYDPNMTVAQLSEKNKILSSVYLTSFHPNHQGRPETKSLNNDHSSVAHQDQRVKRPNDSVVSKELEQSGVQQKTMEQNADRDEFKSTVTSKASIERTNYSAHSQNTKVATNDHLNILLSTLNGQSMQQEVQSSETTSNRTRSTNSHRKSSTRPHFWISPTTYTSHNPRRVGQSTVPISALALRSIHTAESQTSRRPSQATSTTNTHLSQSSSQPTQLVPLTLQPNVPSHARSCDEDPNIMPIPRSPQYQFDARQLQDIETIRRGGNGCARQGEEFEIEEDHDFGGGGIMASKSSRVTSISARRHPKENRQRVGGKEIGVFDTGDTRSERDKLWKELPGMV